MRVALSSTAAALPCSCVPVLDLGLLLLVAVVITVLICHGVVCASGEALGTVAIGCVAATPRAPPFDTQGKLLQQFATNAV